MAPRPIDAQCLAVKYSNNGYYTCVTLIYFVLFAVPVQQLLLSPQEAICKTCWCSLTFERLQEQECIMQWLSNITKHHTSISVTIFSSFSLISIINIIRIIRINSYRIIRITWPSWWYQCPWSYNKSRAHWQKEAPEGEGCPPCDALEVQCLL